MVKSVTAAQGSIKKRGARVDSAPAPPLTISSSTRGSLEIVIIDPATYAKNKDSVAAAFKEACGVPGSFHAQVDVKYSLDSDVKTAIGEFYGGRDKELDSGITRCNVSDLVRGFGGHVALPADISSCDSPHVFLLSHQASSRVSQRC